MLELFLILLIVFVLVLVGLAAVMVVLAYASQIAYVDSLHEKDENE